MVSFSIVSRTALYFLTVSSLTGCIDGISVAPISQAPISSDFTTFAIDPAVAGANTHVFIKVQDSYGYVGICGAIVTSDEASLSEIELNLRSQYYVVLDEDLVLNNLRLLNIVHPPETPQTAQATCVATDILWRENYVGAQPILRHRGG